MDLFPNALFNLFHAICWQVYPPNLSPGIKVKGWKGEKVKRWKGERMQRLYKEQKANNAVHLPLYWNVLRFSFTIIDLQLLSSPLI